MLDNIDEVISDQFNDFSISLVLGFDFNIFRNHPGNRGRCGSSLRISYQTSQVNFQVRDMYVQTFPSMFFVAKAASLGRSLSMILAYIFNLPN